MARHHPGSLGSLFDRLMSASALGAGAGRRTETWLAVVLTATAAILTLATGLDPFVAMLAGGCLGFAGVV